MWAQEWEQIKALNDKFASFIDNDGTAVAILLFAKQWIDVM